MELNKNKNILYFSVVSPGVYSQREAEEGGIGNNKYAFKDKKNNEMKLKPVNYPVGKPLEVFSLNLF